MRLTTNSKLRPIQFCSPISLKSNQPRLELNHSTSTAANSRGVNGLGGSHDRRGGEEGRPPQKRARDAKYAIPTMEEACLLRETEGNLFEGNVLRLEVEELLGEVRVDYGKRTVKALEVRRRYFTVGCRYVTLFNESKSKHVLSVPLNDVEDTITEPLNINNQFHVQANSIPTLSRLL